MLTIFFGVSLRAKLHIDGDGTSENKTDGQLFRAGIDIYMYVWLPKYSQQALKPLGKFFLFLFNLSHFLSNQKRS